MARRSTHSYGARERLHGTVEGRDDDQDPGDGLLQDVPNERRADGS
jgi:hypothetical protein